MDDVELTIHFPEASAAAAGALVAELERVLRDSAADEDVEIVLDRRRERNDTQDIGTILAVTLGTHAASALARGIAQLVAKRGDRLEIRADGSVLATGDGTKQVDVARVIEAVNKVKPKTPPKK